MQLAWGNATWLAPEGKRRAASFANCLLLCGEFLAAIAQEGQLRARGNIAR